MGGEVNQGRREQHSHPADRSVLDPAPLPAPCILAWLLGGWGLKALPSYQPGSLARALPWCRGLPCP